MMKHTLLLLVFMAAALPAQMFQAGLSQAIPELDRGGAGAPTATCTPGQRYFQTDAAAGYNDWTCTATNTWTQGSKSAPAYGEMYFYTPSVGAPTPLGINVVNQYHGVALAATGTTLVGWTYKTGVAGTVTAVADNGGVTPGTILLTTSAPHNLAPGDFVCQTGFTTRTTYQGKYRVLTTPLATTYTVTRAFQVSTDTGFFQRAWSLRANTGSAGIYHVTFTMSAQALSGTTDFRFELNQNALDLDNIAAQILFGTANRPDEFTGAGLITVVDNDVIYMSVKNITDSSDFSVWLSNLSLHRL